MDTTNTRTITFNNDILTNDMNDKAAKFISSKVHHRSIVNRLIVRLKRRKHEKLIVKKHLHTDPDMEQKTILSMLKLIDYTPATTNMVINRMLQYANNQQDAILRARLVQYVNNLVQVHLQYNNGVASDKITESYLNNFNDGRVPFVQDANIIRYIERSGLQKKFKKYLIKYELTQDLQYASSDYYPFMHGKQTNLGKPGVAAWVYHLKVKNCFKARTGSLLKAMSNDLRVYLQNQQPPINITNEDDYSRYVNSIVNAFIPDEVEMYARDLLRSKHILSGINEYNKAIEGDFSYIETLKTRILPKHETLL